MFRFAYPQAFALLFLLVPVVYFGLRRRGRERSIAYSSIDLLDAAGFVAPAWKRHVLLVLRSLILVFLVVAIARPQTGRSEHKVETHGIDIVLLLDTSSSMQAQDFKPDNRLHVAKQVVKDFIGKRRNDRIGLVVFAAQAVTQCPLTLDYGVLQRLVDRIEFGMLEDGTAVGTALATACNRLKDSDAKSRIVILLTDGRNNMGLVAPRTAAEVARSLGIKVYTIGVGTRGPVPVPVSDPIFGKRIVSMAMDLDEDTLKEVAALTDGEYFRATDTEELAEIYDKIDRLEKTRIEAKTFTSFTDRFSYFALPAVVILIAQVALGESILREIP